MAAACSGSLDNEIHQLLVAVPHCPTWLPGWAEENGTTCRYAVQDKMWVHGLGSGPREVYPVKADAPNAGRPQRVCALFPRR